MPALVEVVHEDADLLVLRKPAGLVCHPTKGDEFSSLISRLRIHAGGGPVFLVNRLDRETSGVTLVARSAPVAGELGRLFESRAVAKLYLAIVHGHPAEDAFLIEAALGRDVTSAVAIKDTVRADGAPASTRVRTLRRFERDGRPFALLQVEPRTGRKHQIRIHLAHAGHPIVGDKIYGDSAERYLRFVEGRLTDEDRAALILANHALHAASLRFTWRGVEREFRTEPEACFTEFAANSG